MYVHLHFHIIQNTGTTPYRVGMMATALLPLCPKLRWNISQLTILQFKIHSQQDGLWRDLFGVDQ